MFNVKWKDDHGTHWAVFTNPPRKGAKCDFTDRRSAVNWCRNQYRRIQQRHFTIVHPDDYEEKYVYKPQP